MMRASFLCMVVAACVALVSPAAAQPTETGETGLIAIPTAGTLPPGKVSVGAYARRDIESDRQFDPALGGLRDTDFTLGQFSLGVGILEGFELTTQFTWADFQVDQPEEDIRIRDVGNVRISPKFQLFREGETLMPFSLGVLGSASLPVGDDDLPAALDRSTLMSEEVAWEVMAILDKTLFTLPGDAPVVLSLNAGGLFPGDPDTPHDARDQTQPVFAQLRRKGISAFDVEDQVVQYGAGLRIPLWKDHLGELDLLSEFRGNTGTIDEVDDYRAILGGLRYMVWNGLALQAGVDFGLTNSVDRFNIVGGLSYTGPQNYELPVPEPETKTKVVYKDRIVEVERITFDDVNFEFDKATLTHQGKGRVYLIAEKLKEGKDVKIEIRGHTDYIGTEDYNKQLGLRRAETVKQELIRLGVDPTRISTVSFGEGEPLIGKETPWARAVNRRAEFVVVSEPTAEKTEQTE